MRHDKLLRWTVGLILAVSLGVVSAVATEETLNTHPGFIDFSQFGQFSDDQLEIHVGIQEVALRLVAAATRSSDPDLSSMLEGLKRIEVWVYDVDDETREGFEKSVGKIARELERRDWAQAMTLRSEGTHGYMYLKLEDDKPQGLVASIISDEDQAIFVNIVGEIDPSQVGRLAAKFDLGGLEEAVAPPAEDPSVEEP